MKLTAIQQVIFIIALAFILDGQAIAQQPEADTVNKSQYHLFNPTPKINLRDLSTDRPDKTESAYTVDAGHFQMETSFLDYTRDRHNSDSTQEETDNFAVMATNLKIGLTNNTDVQLVIEPYHYQSASDDSEKTLKKGFGDITTRLKFNVWGNDVGSTAFALMPFVKFPTNGANLGNDSVEGGLILPLAISLPGEWKLGLMAEFDATRNSEEDGYHPEFIQSITLSHSILGPLSGYLEFFYLYNSEEDAQPIGTIDTGLTYTLTADVQLDAGVNWGATRAADDFNPFCGIAWRY